MKNTRQEEYTLLKDAYEGMGGFVDGGYLVKHPREDPKKYSLRQKLSYYLNYFKPIIDAHVSPIFKKLAKRDYTGLGAKAWAQFIYDVDFKGTKLEHLMKRAARKAKIYGICYIVMDKAESAAEVNSLEQLEADRVNSPYVFIVDPAFVDEVVMDKYGRITSFIYKEIDAYKESAMATRTLTPKGWSLEDSKGLHQGSWNLGFVPVVPVYAKADEDVINPFPASDFISVAKTNLAIFNMCSWLNDIFINQNFSILTYPSNNGEDLVLGTSNALGYAPESSHEPKFIAPDSAPATMLSNEINRLQNECYRMAGVVNVTGVRSEQSGVAKQWDFEQTNQTLADFADVLEMVERRLAYVFAKFTGAEFEYTVAYPSDFSVADIATELANAEVAKGLNFCDGFNVEIFKKVLTAYLPELEDKDFDGLVDEYEKALEGMALDVIQDVPLPEKEEESEENNEA